MKTMKYLLPLVLVLSLLIAGCGRQAVPAEDPADAVQTDVLAVDQRSAILNTGDTLTLTVTGGNGEVTYASSDPEVVSVDGSGNVKALKKGHAMITATCGEETAKCGILVEPAGEMVDLTNTQATPVFSDVQLYHQHEIVDFAADAEAGAFYMSQQYAQKIASDTMLTKVTQVNGVWQRSDYVHLYNHGFGYFALEKDGSDVYLLSESNGVSTNRGTTISRVQWESQALFDEEFGDTYELAGLEGSPRPASDPESDLVVVFDYNGRESYYAIYDRSALYSGEENNYLHRFRCESRQQPVNGEDDSNGKYNSAIRDFTVKDGYIYQLSGSGKLYISVFDFEGRLQYCHEVTDYPDLPIRMPGGISFSGDDLYIAVCSANTTVVYYAHVWKLEEVAK